MLPSLSGLGILSLFVSILVFTAVSGQGPGQGCSIVSATPLEGTP